MVPQEAALPIMLAMTSNTASKIVFALAAGTRDFAIRVVPGLVFAIAVTWARLFASSIMPLARWSS